MKSSKRSRLQEVYLTDEISYLNCWQAAYLDPQLRLEYEGFPVPVSRAREDPRCSWARLTACKVGLVRAFCVFLSPFHSHLKLGRHSLVCGSILPWSSQLWLTFESSREHYRTGRPGPAPGLAENQRVETGPGRARFFQASATSSFPKTRGILGK